MCAKGVRDGRAERKACHCARAVEWGRTRRTLVMVNFISFRNNQRLKRRESVRNPGVSHDHLESSGCNESRIKRD